MEIKAYEGSEKYIFVSYAHRDSAAVFNVVGKLVEKGYRIWYDEGITPGSEWPENIARHLDRCEAVIAFVTPNSMASDNCRREITFALTRKKPFLSIVLEKTEMPLGVELQLSAQQSVLRYNFKTEEAFLEKIYTCSSLHPCLNQPETKQETAENEPAAKEDGQKTNTVTGTVTEPPVDSGKKAAPEKKKKTEKKKETEKKEKAKKKSSKILIVIAAVIAVIAATGIIGSIAGKTTIAGNKVKKNATGIYLTDKTVTADDILKINRLKKLRYVYFTNCTFDSSGADQLTCTATGINFTDCTGIESFDFLKNLNELTGLTVQNCGLTQIPDMTGYNLVTVNLSKNSEFDALEKLPLATVESLDISGTAVTDIAPLSACEKMTTLHCGSNGISDISAIAGLSELKELDFSGCKLTKITKPFKCLYLSKLNLADNTLTDVSGFSDMTVLTNLDLSGNKLNDVSWISKNAGTLTSLSLSGNFVNTLFITNSIDLAFLKDCSQLTTLQLDDIDLNNLSFCSGIPELTTLSAVNCGIVDISGLKNCTKLKKAYLALNSISDISALSGVGSEGFTVLDLAFNNISDISPLNCIKIGTAALQGNPLSIKPDSFSELTFSTLAIDYRDGLDTCGLSQSGFSTIYLTGCPGDKQVALKNVIPSVRFVTREEQLEALSDIVSYEKWSALVK